MPGEQHEETAVSGGFYGDLVYFPQDEDGEWLAVVVRW